MVLFYSDHSHFSLPNSSDANTKYAPHLLMSSSLTSPVVSVGNWWRGSDSRKRERSNNVVVRATAREPSEPSPHSNSQTQSRQQHEEKLSEESNFLRLSPRPFIPGASAKVCCLLHLPLDLFPFRSTPWMMMRSIPYLLEPQLPTRAVALLRTIAWEAQRTIPAIPPSALKSLP